MTILVTGLRGGLDIINASLLYYVAKAEGKDVILGACRSKSLSRLGGKFESFADSGALVGPETTIRARGRYVEPLVSQTIKEKVLYFGRKFEDKSDLARFREAVLTARERFGITDHILVDGGGDSLILQHGDGIEGVSETFDPYEGGDAEVMVALKGIPNTYLALVSVGLDIDVKKFWKNLTELNKIGGYFGRVHLVNRELENYVLSDIVSFTEPFLQPYFDLAEERVIMSLDDFDDPGKMRSHTAVVTYHALKGHFGMQRTYVDWEPKVEGRLGVNVTNNHNWMYFFDLTRVEALKDKFNKI
jgi:hypothetical protein